MRPTSASRSATVPIPSMVISALIPEIGVSAASTCARSSPAVVAARNTVVVGTVLPGLDVVLGMLTEAPGTVVLVAVGVATLVVSVGMKDTVIVGASDDDVVVLTV